MHLQETVLQFGTGKFLRCFADLFVHEVNEAGGAMGRVVVLQSTGAERAKAFNDQGGRYHVAIRGLDQGRRVDRTLEVQSVGRALAASTDWPDVVELARSESLLTIISNTTEAGYELAPSDESDGTPPRSFPAKLLAVLRARFEAGLPGVAILPCELLEGNGGRLLGLVVRQAEQWGLSDGLVEWVRSECRWHDTLVDRIVSAPSPKDPLSVSDPLFAVAEPFALWLIEGSDGAGALAEHPAVEFVERLEPYYLRKVRILNGAHTALVAKARPLGFETVREAVLDSEVGAWLKALLMEEIVPTLEGRTEGPEQFALDSLERFANPFLEHRLADIALHHDMKLRTRLAPTLEEFRRRFGRAPRHLSEIVP